MTHTQLTVQQIGDLLLQVQNHYERFAELLRRELWAEADEEHESALYAVGLIQTDLYSRGL